MKTDAVAIDQLNGLLQGGFLMKVSGPEPTESREIRKHVEHPQPLIHNHSSTTTDLQSLSNLKK